MQRYTRVRTGTLLRPDSKRLPAEPPFTIGVKVPDGISEIAYTVELNEEGLRLLILKAASNKRKQSTDGPLLVKITRVSKVKEVAA
jgi:hypothetical protein